MPGRSVGKGPVPKMRITTVAEDGRTKFADLEDTREHLEQIREKIIEAHKTGTDVLVPISAEGSSSRFWLASRITEIGEIEG